MFKTRIITLFILIVSLTVIAVAATTAAAQDRVKIHKVAEVDNTGSVSSDGRSLTYTDWTTGNLAVRDLATGEKRQLTILVLNVPFSHTVKMIEALIRAGKPYDLLVLPGQGHDVTEESKAYVLYELDAIRRYFQEHLKP